MSHPIVSVLMPVYNGEAYLSEAINSVLNQTFTDFEFIIINDGSTDNTQNIIDSFTDDRIHAVKQINCGVAQSLNNAISIAKGKYIWRHDADDSCVPEQLETQFKFLETHREFALVSTQIAFMTDRGRIASNYKQPKDSYFKDKSFVKVERHHFNPYSPITHATVLLKKDVFNTIGLYRTEFKTSEDTDLWLRIIEKYDAAVLNFCSYFVRLNATSATQVYKHTNTFYRDLAFQFADIRADGGVDPIERGEPMPKPTEDKTNLEAHAEKPRGKIFRGDILNFKYKVALDAKDYKNVWNDIRLALKDGWRLSKTWRAIIFPILGKKIVNTGVKIKQMMT